MKPIDYYKISLECSDIEEFKKKCPEGYEFVTTNNLKEEWFDNRYKVMTVERAIELSHNCIGRIEFKAKYPRAHSLLRAKRMLNSLTWLKKLPHNTKQTKEMVLEIMSHYNSVYEFRTNEPEAYNAAIKYHLTKDYPWKEKKEVAKPRKWTKEQLLDFISENDIKYKAELRKHGSAYHAALNMGLMDELGLLSYEKKWTPEKIFELAKQYNNRTKFYEEQSAAYEAARSMGIIKDVLAHMPIYHVDHYNRNELYVIYLYADEENKVGYVGLTKNLKQRHYQHSKPYGRGGKYDSIASYFINQGKSLPEPQILYSDLCPEDASHMEVKAYHEYIEKGWTMLNEEKELGALGGHVRKWSLELIKELIASANIEYMLDFMKTFKNAYQSARANGWLEELNLKHINKPNGYWQDPEHIIEAAKEFDKWSDFEHTYYQAARMAIKLGLDLGLKKMELHEKGYWTDEQIIKEAKECKTLKEFREHHKIAYGYSIDRGLLESFTWLERGIRHWTLEEATELAKTVNSWTELRKLNISCESWCVRNKVDFPWFKPKIKRKLRTSKQENKEEDN